jgi:heme oxygenase
METIDTAQAQAAAFIKDLRAGTQEWHEKLEELELSKSILKADIQPEDYKRYLAAMYGFVKPFESQAYPALAAIVPDIEDRRKTHLMEQDLRALGYTDTQIAALPLADWQAGTAAGNMGALYVMEGSALGGMVISKHIQATLGLDASNGASFFQPYGAALGAKWKAFLGVFTGYTQEHQCAPEVISTATDTFKAIYHWFAAYE